MNEVVNTYKRKLLTDNYNVHYLLELYDINELNNSTLVDNKRVISVQIYKKIKEYLLKELQKNKIDQVKLNQAKFKSINDIANSMSMNITITSIPMAIKDLLQGNYPSYVLKDFYGNSIFQLYHDPFDYFSVYREYYQLVKRYTPEKEVVYRKPMAFFNEKTGKFGDQTGTLYQVEYLEKDWGTHEPLKVHKINMEKNLRTNIYEPQQIVVYKHGKIPFIRRNLPTTSNQVKEIWTEVPKAYVKFFTPGHDSCSRFKTETTCNSGLGINERKCIFQNNVCKSSFGKKNKSKN
jgi:hypothetical protein